MTKTASLTNTRSAIRVAFFPLVISLMAAPAILLSTPTQAATQSLSAQVDGKLFESDDRGMTLVPVQDGFTISASTKGFSVYPPPAGLSDRLSITCNSGYGKIMKYTASDFNDDRCRASFTKGESNQPFGKAQGEYVTGRRVGPKTFLEITKAGGKVIEGRFSLELVDDNDPKKGIKLVITDGVFKAEDRQIK